MPYDNMMNPGGMPRRKPPGDVNNPESGDNPLMNAINQAKGSSPIYGPNAGMAPAGAQSSGLGSAIMGKMMGKALGK